MNQLEYEALDAETLPLEAVALYVRGFRRHMSYDTGRTLVSLASMRQRIEFVPPAGSTVKYCKPTVQKVRSLIDSLVRHGLIRLVERGDKQSRKPAVFLCVLASSDLVRLNEEQHENNTRTTRSSNTGNVVNLKARSGFGQNLGKSEEQHSSVCSEQEDIYTREGLIFDEQFKGMAKQAMLNVCDAELLGYFDAFKFSTKDDGAFKPVYVHLKAWRQYCVSIRNNLVKNEVGNEISKSVGTNGAPKSATARTVLRGLERYRNRYDGQFDEIG